MSGNLADERVFDHDPTTGISEFFLFNPEDDSFTIRTQQDNESQILEINAEIRKDRTGRFGEWDHIAHIPAVVYAQLKRDGVADDPARLKRWLNASENRMFRVREGRV
jgi:hypothetical protein